VFSRTLPVCSPEGDPACSLDWKTLEGRVPAKLPLDEEEGTFVGSLRISSPSQLEDICVDFELNATHRVESCSGCPACGTQIGSIDGVAAYSNAGDQCTGDRFSTSSSPSFLLYFFLKLSELNTVVLAEELGDFNINAWNWFNVTTGFSSM
jgi:hypothetical protein